LRLFRLFAVSSLAGYEVPAASPRRCGEAAHLYHNNRDGTFTEVSSSMGINGPYRGFPCWAWDYDNDGFLDMNLGTCDPNLATLVPNRMFKNIAGERFADVTYTSGTGHLQKRHGVACGDWDRNGDIDIFIEMGGPVSGEKYHNILFQNPGQGNHSLTVKLIGKKTNRAAIGARIKVVTAGERPLSIHRHVSSGGSFGANPLQQTNGLARAERVALLEVHWPTSGTTQVFRNIAADQAIEVTEFAADYRALGWTPTPAPKSASSLRPARPADLLPKPGMARERPGRRDEGPGAG
jgi:ASPIC and UnbV/FG-GAP-like repeat